MAVVRPIPTRLLQPSSKYLGILDECHQRYVAVCLVSSHELLLCSRTAGSPIRNRCSCTQGLVIAHLANQSLSKSQFLTIWVPIFERRESTTLLHNAHHRICHRWQTSVPDSLSRACFCTNMQNNGLLLMQPQHSGAYPYNKNSKTALHRQLLHIATHPAWPADSANAVTVSTRLSGP